MKGMLVLLLSLMMISLPAHAIKRFGERYCNNPDYFCIKIRPGDSWDSLFPYAEEQDMVRRINRMNIRLRAGMIIAIPKNIERLTIYDVSPFPRYIKSPGERTIYVSQKQMAWAAYDDDGELLWWGPISPGSMRCQGCATPSGSFRIIRKQDYDCVSTAFPRRANGDHGGAEMPYCMHFFRGYALHGSATVPGYPDSHGCVRMFTEDARWLNEEFIDTADTGYAGTRVIIDDIN